MTNCKWWKYIAMILVVGGTMMFTFLGSQPLLDPDEPVYAETAREMLQFHDFISPRIFGDFWYDKPPMYYWLVAAAFKVFGVGEFGARFPSALLAVSGAVLIYFSGRRLFNERAGLLAALVLVTSLEYFYLGNAAVTDMTLTFFLMAALLSFLHQKYYLLYAFAALAVMTKGPVAIFFCTVIIGLYLVLTGNLKRVRSMKLISGMAIFAVIALPWYGVMYYLHGMDFINTFLGFHNVTRFLQPEHSSGAVFYYYVPVLLLGFFPWITFLFQAVWESYREVKEQRRTCLFLLIWAAVVFGFFSLSQTKLISYILPMYPPLALLVGYYYDKIWAEKRGQELRRSAILFGAVAFLLISGLIVAGRETAEMMPVVKIMAVYVSLLAVFILFQSWRQRFCTVYAGYILGMLVFTALLMTKALPLIVPEVSVKALASGFQQYYDGQSPVYVAKFYRPGFMYYSGIAGTEINSKELEGMLHQKGKAYFILKKKEYDALSPVLQNKLRVLDVQKDKISLCSGNDS